MHFSRRQKLWQETQSLLLDTQHNHKGESPVEKVCVAEIEVRQRCTPGGKGWGVPLSEEEPCKEAVKAFIQGSSSGSLYTLGQLSGFFFHLWPTLGPSPICLCNTMDCSPPVLGWNPFSSVDSSPDYYKAALASHTVGGAPSFGPGGFCAHVQCLPRPKDGKRETSWAFTQTGCSPFCFCHACYLQVSTEDTAWLFSLFLLSFLFQSAKRRLVVNTWSGAPPISYLRKCKWEASCPAWSPFFFFFWSKKRKQEPT